MMIFGHQLMFQVAKVTFFEPMLWMVFPWVVALNPVTSQMKLVQLGTRPLSVT